jgi:serine/threonine protein kinase
MLRIPFVPRYVIQQKLGSGGMADIFLASACGPEGFERTSVLKRIRTSLATSREFVQLFIDEAMLSAQLIHPNIVHVYDFGAMDGGYFIAMERVLGRDLRWMLTRLAQRAVVPVPAIAAEIGRQCCLALEYAHGLQATDGKPLDIVHRDVTPANIMVSYDGSVKLLDFGVARTHDPQRRAHTDAGVVKGKLSYLSPEQLRNEPHVDRRSDLFALGIVLHELLCWRSLFRGKTDLETIRRVLEMPIVLPSTVNHGVSAALDRIIMKALERDRERRYQCAGDMADDLERYLVLSRRSGRVMRRLMHDTFEPIWRDSLTADNEPDTLLEPPRSEGSVTLDAASCIIDGIRAASEPVPAKQRPRRFWGMIGGAVAVALMLAGAVAWPSLKAPPPKTSVSISVDSVPQGALVYTTDPVLGLVGETPLVLTVERSRERSAYLLIKEGFNPTTVRVIPDQDKPVLAQLKAASPPAAARTTR